jgi:hypothetical protein
MKYQGSFGRRLSGTSGIGFGGLGSCPSHGRPKYGLMIREGSATSVQSSGQMVNVNNAVANRIQDHLGHGVEVELAHEVGTMSLGGLDCTS